MITKRMVLGWCSATRTPCTRFFCEHKCTNKLKNITGCYFIPDPSLTKETAAEILTQSIKGGKENGI